MSLIPEALDPAAFPANIVDELAEIFTELPVVAGVAGRPLRQSDPHRSVGVYAIDWMSDDYVIGQVEANSSIYQVNIQTLVRFANEIEGRRDSALFSKYLRTMVVRDAGVRERLAALSESSSGVLERMQSWKCRRQLFIPNELNGEFICLTVAEFLFTVETVQV